MLQLRASGRPIIFRAQGQQLALRRIGEVVGQEEEAGEVGTEVEMQPHSVRLLHVAADGLVCVRRIAPMDSAQVGQ